MFRASSAHLQEVNDVNCTCMQPLDQNKIVQKQCGHLVQQNMQDRIPEAAYMYN